MSPPLPAVAVVLLLPLLWRWVPGRQPEGAGWAWRVDGPLLALAAALGGGLQVGWLVDFHLAQGVVASSDFEDWCAAVATLAAGQPGAFPAHRPMLVARGLVGLARSVGTADALLLGAQLSAFVGCAGLFLWGRALHGRLAGLSAALFAGALGPLVSLGRTLSFYPELTAVFTLGAGLAAGAARSGSVGAMGLAGLGIGLCLLVDLRGLVWALPLLGVAGLGLLRPPRRVGTTALRVLALGLPLVGAWAAAPLAYHPDTGSLEEQADLRMRMWEWGLRDPQYAPPWSHSTRYVWGTTPLRDIPATLLHFRAQQQLAPDPSRLESFAGANRRRHVEPWAGLVAASTAVALFGLALRPTRLVAGLGTALPFVAALQGAITFQVSAVRFLGQAAPVVALGLGLCWATLAQGAPARDTAAQNHAIPHTARAWAWWAGAAALCLALVVGVLPSMLSPAASWRGAPEALPDGYRSVRCVLGTAAGDPGACQGGEQARDPRCVGQLRAELAQGLNLRTRALPPEPGTP